MKRTLISLLIAAAVALALATVGCGTGTANPAAPGVLPAGDLTAQKAIDKATPTPWGVYDVAFDPSTGALDYCEVRDGETHYNITPYLIGHVVINLIGFDPTTHVLDFEMQITNPSAVDVFDVRTIFLSPALSGYSLLNPDDYTKLFSPYPPHVVNPFVAYATSTANRVFPASSTHGAKFKVQCPALVTLPLKFRLLVECSWPSNCQEPYLIDNQSLSNPISTTTSGTISLEAYDHQHNIDTISVDTTPITGGLTYLATPGGDWWNADIKNTMGAPIGIYRCLIDAKSLATNDDLYDFIDIEVVPSMPPMTGWSSVSYPLPTDLGSLDLGVISDPGGPRDSEILMPGDGEKGDKVMIFAPGYAVSGEYVNLVDYDPANDQYQPYPVLRIDSADDGAFSFTNTNSTLPYPNPVSTLFNDQIWSVFDNTPRLHLGPATDEARYYFDFGMEAKPRPVDVCDDFDLGQYTLFSTGGDTKKDDLIFMGTMPSSYTYDKVKFVACLDPWIGMEAGQVDPGSIYAIDVDSYTPATGGPDVANLYILEDSAGYIQVEVFWIVDTASGWDYDMVGYKMTIHVDYLEKTTWWGIGHDIELLPPNKDYELNPDEPTLCVLLSWADGTTPLENGEVVLYNAETGAFLEAMGTIGAPSMPKSSVKYLDTDDHDWQIHVTRFDSSGNPVATVFSYY
jgi:hypothetical protein